MPEKNKPIRCDGWRRHGGAFTIGRPVWSQCENDATVLLTIEQEGKVLTDSPACAECWAEGIERGIKQLSAKPITKDTPCPVPS